MAKKAVFVRGWSAATVIRQPAEPAKKNLLLGYMSEPKNEREIAAMVAALNGNTSIREAFIIIFRPTELSGLLVALARLPSMRKLNIGLPMESWVATSGGAMAELVNCSSSLSELKTQSTDVHGKNRRKAANSALLRATEDFALVASGQGRPVTSAIGTAFRLQCIQAPNT